MTNASWEQPSEREQPSVAVVTALADAEDVDPAELEPLYDRIDLDALDRLFAPRDDGTPRDAGRVRFRTHGYEVVVTASGRVDLTELDRDAE